MSLRKPDRSEHSASFAAYIDLVPEGDWTERLQEQTERTRQLFASIREEDGNYRYAPEKWTVKQLLGHIADTERIMSYRILRVARGDATPLPGFDENDYVREAGFERQSLADLLQSFLDVRRATLSLIGSIPESSWLHEGIANGGKVTARAVAYILAGHERHHIRVLEERYAAVIAKL